MKSIGKFKIYFNTKAWGWIMYGFGWDNKIFVGVSIAQKGKIK